MRKTVGLILVIPLLLSACAGQASAPDVAGPTPTARVLMQATDPATVSLATGTPQLFEFFTYW